MFPYCLCCLCDALRMLRMRRLRGVAVAVLLVVGTVAGCGGGTSTSTPTAPSTPASTLSSSPTPVGPAVATGPARYVTVGFWQDTACAGTPTATTAFPLHYDSPQCFSSPGRSGENSVSLFSCGQDSFSYTQWTTLTCSGGQVPAGTRKTVTSSSCTQGYRRLSMPRFLILAGVAPHRKPHHALSTRTPGGGLSREVHATRQRPPGTIAANRHICRLG